VKFRSSEQFFNEIDRTPWIPLDYGTYSYEYYCLDAGLGIREGSLDVQKIIFISALLCSRGSTIELVIPVG
jgi:hypothetical protein